MPVIASAEAFARSRLEGRGCGHDFFHADRVRRTALKLAGVEGGDRLVVELATLLHDVADPKLVADPEGAAREVEAFLRGLAIDGEIVAHVLDILGGMSFGAELRGGVRPVAEKSVEFRVVQDADRLDALGAIGIARCFAYGGSVNQPLHDPGLAPRGTLTHAEYRNGRASSLNHFDEKLFRLRERMNTETARRWAAARHTFLEDFKARFLAEWDGADAPEGV